MELIIGGAYQGKTEYAKSQYPQIAWIDGKTCRTEEIYSAEGVLHFEAYLERMVQDGVDVSNLAEEMHARNPKTIVICQEMGYGVVPMDSFLRQYREIVGRVCTKLAGYSKKVTRVVCGVGMVIKDDTN